jgi:glycosyltransferase involved in cell wall biosynthesis
MKILVFPRDPNPYQELLYSEMRQLGVNVSYLGTLTRSRTLNLLLLPAEVAVRRATGARLVHLHWVFPFTFPGGQHFPVIRVAAYLWFRIWLHTCRLAGLRLVWTAHNVLPHSPVFPDDVAARQVLVRASDLVLAHSPAALAELATFGAVVRRSALVGHGPIAPAHPIAWRRTLDHDSGPRRFLFFGQVHEYKGVDDLLIAFAAMPAGISASLLVAGRCEDARLKVRLSELASSAGERVTLRLEHVPQDEVTGMLCGADVVVLPYHSVTTSGSAMLALAHGRPLIVPDLAGLADLPDQAVVRYRGGIPGLTEALERLARTDEGTLVAMSAAASNYSSRTTWQDIAQTTTAAMQTVLCPRPGTRRPGAQGAVAR